MPHRLVQWISRLAGQHILVIGDVILDEYLIGRATRMSREAPIPVLEFESRQLIPGGAANPAANIVSLGSTVTQVGVIGSDVSGTNLRQVLQTRHINTDCLVTDSARPTTVKTRIMAQMGLRFPQQVARMDTLSREAISPALEQDIVQVVQKQIAKASAVLLSDYQTGMLTATLVAKVRELAMDAGILLTADAQGQFDKYIGFGLVKCNAEEASTYLRRDLRSDADFAEAAQELCRTLQLTGAMFITRGVDGATVATCDAEVLHRPAPAVSDVYDTVGAGDTAIAVLTLCAAAGVPYSDAALLANYASGLVVRRVGNYAPTPDELRWALETWG